MAALLVTDLSELGWRATTNHCDDVKVMTLNHGDAFKGAEVYPFSAGLLDLACAYVISHALASLVVGTTPKQRDPNISIGDSSLLLSLPGMAGQANRKDRIDGLSAMSHDGLPDRLCGAYCPHKCRQCASLTKCVLYPECRGEKHREWRIRNNKILESAHTTPTESLEDPTKLLEKDKRKATVKVQLSGALLRLLETTTLWCELVSILLEQIQGDGRVTAVSFPHG